MAIKQILISLGISLVITIVLNAVLYMLTGAFGWQNVLFLGLLFGLAFPFSRKRRR